MKRVLFIDRDGTLLREPEDEQIDSWDKFEFLPGVIRNLGYIAENTDFELVMVTNQDGLGTNSFPEENFRPFQNKMLQILKGEGITFNDILIDRSFPEDKAPTRKPGTAMLTKYLKGDYNLTGSYVIGDRQSDADLAGNLGAKSILITENKNLKGDFLVSSWKEIPLILCFEERKVEIKRETRETKVFLNLNVDGRGDSDIHTGIGFFDHMLEQVGFHSKSDLKIIVQGDLQVDEHHTVEDTAIALGQAYKKALGDKKQINRYAFLLPMDESLAQVALDFSGRSYLQWDVSFTREKIGDMPTELFKHFFESFVRHAECTLHIQARGENEHHIAEAIFKAFGKTLRQAMARHPENADTASTKGVL
ncbi:MAG: bifunctional histidinol-phosphatase/imidazoleglycerol-phosphate dehydratase HisB [Candidatus Marinimicrobia bacterium]|nr:bifunctional histidinol-phosphatase/imidazoleglycerol-phosphate dehydratase HisB [Candidatus Neomarinimicrobiota bacterium]